MQRNRLISDEIMNAIPSKEGMSAAEWLAEQMPGGFFIYKAQAPEELLYLNRAVLDIFGCETTFWEMLSSSPKAAVRFCFALKKVRVSITILRCGL